MGPSAPSSIVSVTGRDGRRRVPAAEAVHPDAQVSLRVDGAAAEGTAWPAGAQHLGGALDERASRTGRDPHQEKLVGLRLLEVLLHLLGRHHGGL